MGEETKGRRAFLKGALAGAAAASTSLPVPAAAQQAGTAQPLPQPSGGVAYAFLNADEAAFIEAVVDHMIPADEHSPKGTDLGINVYIDRALAGAWGKGERLYLQGPWKQGTPNQGYQLPLTPAELYRAGIAGANAACVKAHGKPFERLAAAEKEAFLLDLRAGKVPFAGGLPSRVFFFALYQNVMEGLFSDPIYGGNRGKAGWKMLGFPGVIAVHYQNVEKFRDKPYKVDPVSISDMS
jgi:gluconate 2-dehydrogenase gamma chain